MAAESTEMTSMGQRAARALVAALLPAAVGPARHNTGCSGCIIALAKTGGLTRQPPIAAKWGAHDYIDQRAGWLPYRVVRHSFLPRSVRGWHVWPHGRPSWQIVRCAAQ